MSEQEHDVGKHPKGTIAVIALYGVLFVLGWLAVFVLIYLPRGAVMR
ncbi:MAG: hypothetical protein OEY63_04995 [Gemmatimonadota bacterium]|nr:hypothetical protein [Gemmatimonadota bacterium]MDH5805854.1 hypothetical protein [Gemmatimonadota bacterium]